MKKHIFKRRYKGTSQVENPEPGLTKLCSGFDRYGNSKNTVTPFIKL